MHPHPVFSLFTLLGILQVAVVVVQAMDKSPAKQLVIVQSALSLSFFFFENQI
jgi:hypothetical protein